MRYAANLDIIIGKTNFLVCTTSPFVSKPGRVPLEDHRQISPVPVPHALQATVHDLLINSQRLNRQNRNSTLAKVFSPGSNCFMLGHPGYGQLGKVLPPSIAAQEGEVHVELEMIHELDDEETKRKILNGAASRYFTDLIVATSLGISSHVVHRLAGSIPMMITFNADWNDHGHIDQSRQLQRNVGIQWKSETHHFETVEFVQKDR